MCWDLVNFTSINKYIIVANQISSRIRKYISTQWIDMTNFLWLSKQGNLTVIMKEGRMKEVVQGKRTRGTFD